MQASIFYPELKNYCSGLPAEFGTISAERKEVLKKIAGYINSILTEKTFCNLTYICVQNSRRSHFGQVWAQVAAACYGITGIESFSGGTEVSELNPNAAAALQKTGLQLSKVTDGQNPRYNVQMGETLPVFTIYSKLYDDTANPQSGFAAIMVCGEGDEACPLVNGADKRFLTPYPDPKKFDGTPQQEKMYDARCQQIATEQFYLFSLLKNQNGQNN